MLTPQPRQVFLAYPSVTCITCAPLSESMEKSMLFLTASVSNHNVMPAECGAATYSNGWALGHAKPHYVLALSRQI